MSSAAKPEAPKPTAMPAPKGLNICSRYQLAADGSAWRCAGVSTGPANFHAMTGFRAWDRPSSWQIKRGSTWTLHTTTVVYCSVTETNVAMSEGIHVAEPGDGYLCSMSIRVRLPTGASPPAAQN